MPPFDEVIGTLVHLPEQSILIHIINMKGWIDRDTALSRLRPGAAFRARSLGYLESLPKEADAIAERAVRFL